MGILIMRKKIEILTKEYEDNINILKEKHAKEIENLKKEIEDRNEKLQKLENINSMLVKELKSIKNQKRTAREKSMKLFCNCGEE